MTARLENPISQSAEAPATDVDDWTLDVTIVEGGAAADQLIRLTDDGCNSTCGTACTTCP
ncbi:FxLD family lanthipeptide [Streptomyces sp. NPDC087440]|uniref:FxLD family lanthipeptide n=1 Tax=Streptomyces sp. NPDC087440 TaxID=3365790 RepID=UPI0037F2BC30